MGRCGSCKAQSQRFCFVHQEFVCERCLVDEETRIHDRCIVSTYRKWIQDSNYSWPPTCAACFKELKLSDNTVRRACMHVEHACCLTKPSSPDHPCGTCEEPLEKSITAPRIGEAIVRRIEGIPALQVVVNHAKSLQKAPAHTNQPKIDTHNANPSVNLERKQEETPRMQYRRQNAALQVIETDVSQNMTQVAPDVSEIPAMSQSASQQWARQKAETKLDMGLPKLQTGGKLSRSTASFKRDRSGGSDTASTVVRKGMKAAARYWMNLRQSQSVRQKQVVVIVLFVGCIVLAGLLMSGEEEAPASVKSVVEGVDLPHIRINPEIRGRAEAVRAENAGVAVDTEDD